MSSFAGVLHKYNFNKVAFEFTPSALPNVLIVVGGMTDGLLTVPYVAKLPEVMEPLGYSVINSQLTSSFNGWGVASLRTDVEEMKELVDYLRSEEGGSRKKIVIMGHSTGSQDVIHYLLTYGDSVQGGILQASVSDREAFGTEVPKKTLKDLTARAKKLCEAGSSSQLLPAEYSKYVFGTPITAYRWCSLFALGGDDDYFSSDLSIEQIKQTFGRIDKPFLIAYSELDEFVPAPVDKAGLIRTRQSQSNPQVWSKASGLIKGAGHNVAQHSSQLYLFDMISQFFHEFNL
ncbi:uncharacterized protein KNAG_0J01630 [Huiozyma naganishii CBS 8797]|uniref:Uncharacterized protein n=1 Tax=Huiozyma naganishii (strain ATCC MYA-139 / BCRC 22969 / CBS 8797 / KCTC 17520 / NBRC 10181 / NCYC 3082 / Yp74L-3) TaxID=1071383 RepID=J7S9Q7_HUIN7|nr:hypothetical protein KNAG_0J01630 [Kazachstania naganishii CBS 8797]CCK72244.1 hypothetical protein KNAG_0J01630 [Kazachstania naganishii CBS 8797]